MYSLDNSLTSYCDFWMSSMKRVHYFCITSIIKITSKNHQIAHFFKGVRIGVCFIVLLPLRLKEERVELFV